MVSDIKFGGTFLKRKITVNVPCPMGLKSKLKTSPITSNGMGNNRCVNDILKVGKYRM